MEWCVDTRVAAAVTAAEADICAHLARHALEPVTVELARPEIAKALREPGAGRLWVGVDWEEAQPLLCIYGLPDGPVAGDLVAPGVARTHDQTAIQPPDGHALLSSARLAVTRAPEADIDPLPRPSTAASVYTPLSVAGDLADELSAGRTLEEAAAVAGATLAEQVTLTSPLTAGDPAAMSELFLEAEGHLGGDFRLVAVDDRRAVFANRRCPFGASVRPDMCRFTSGLAGGIAARLGGGAEVTLDERLALGDPQCRLVVDLAPLSGRPTSHLYSWPPAGLRSLELPESVASARGFRVNLSLQLPRDRLSVPVTRHLISAAMAEVGVIPSDLHEVELALSEACGNVIDHSGPGDVYEVAVTIAPTACHIRVVDLGHGFDYESLTPPEMADVDAEHGRGVALMHALVDQVRFESEPERGTVVHLVKTLQFDDGVPARKLMLESLDSQD